MQSYNAVPEYGVSLNIVILFVVRLLARSYKLYLMALQLEKLLIFILFLSWDQQFKWWDVWTKDMKIVFFFP
jgi:hypothetical protein